MDVATALMACPPAYLAVVVQNLAEAGAEAGIDEEQAYDLVLDSFAGTIDVLRRYDPIEVRRTVASPRGQHRGGPRGTSPTRARRTRSARRWPPR